MLELLCCLGGARGINVAGIPASFYTPQAVEQEQHRFIASDQLI